MKIHLISNMYPSKEYPGYGTFVEKTYEQLLDTKDNRISKTVLYKEKNSFKRKMMYLIFYMKIILKLLFKNYDVIYAHYVSHFAIPILLIMKIKKVNLIVNIHGSDVTSTKPKDQKLDRYMSKALKKSGKIIVPSGYMKNIVIEKYDIDSKKIYIYPSGGIDETLFHPSNLQLITQKSVYEKYSIDSNKKIISYISRVDRGKGWDIALKAISSLKEDIAFNEKWEVLFIGSGSEEEQLSELIRLYELDNIIRIPSLSRQELSLMYNISDWVIFPSELPESLGLVGLESLACGTPVIGSDYAGISTYLNHEYNGLLFEKGNTVDLAEKIKEAINMEEKKYSIIQSNALLSSIPYLSKNIESDLFNILFK